MGDDRVEFSCPFCGKPCFAGDVTVPGEDEAIEGVMHATPTCQTFDDLDPLEFIEKVNDKTLGKEIMARLRACSPGKVGHA